MHTQGKRRKESGSSWMRTEWPESESQETAQKCGLPKAGKEDSEGGPGKALPKLLKLLHGEDGPSRKKEASDGGRLWELGLGGWQRCVPTVCSRSKSTFRFAP